jgi:two-component system sensor histidine kinase RpfC
MDVNMPVLNGIEATKLYRFTTAGGCSVPIIGLTADATPTVAQACLEAGMNACLTKPVEPPRLIETIEGMVQSAPADPAATDADSVVEIASHPRFRPTAPEDPPLDAAMLADLKTLGGEDFVADLLHAFVVEGRELASELAQAASRQDLAGFRAKAHALSSSAANIGATKVRLLCAECRELSLSDLPKAGLHVAQRIADELERVRLAQTSGPDASGRSKNAS